ncbi:MAG: VOC family protein [Lachnospirales bacterium]
MKFNPYFVLKNQASEAIEMYSKAFNGESTIMKFCDAPKTEDYEMPEEYKHLVMYGEVKIKNFSIMISDMPMEDQIIGTNVSTAVNFNNAEELLHAYEILKVDGNVPMEPQSSFFANLYSMLSDKFGNQWQLIYKDEK